MCWILLLCQWGSVKTWNPGASCIITWKMRSFCTRLDQCSSSKTWSCNPQLQPSSTVQKFSSRRRIGAGKLAFLFLMQGTLPLQSLWELYFKGHDCEMYSIHVHVHLNYNFPYASLDSSVFFHHNIPSKVNIKFFKLPVFSFKYSQCSSSSSFFLNSWMGILQSLIWSGFWFAKLDLKWKIWKFCKLGLR